MVSDSGIYGICPHCTCIDAVCSGHILKVCQRYKRALALVTAVSLPLELIKFVLIISPEKVLWLGCSVTHAQKNFVWKGDGVKNGKIVWNRVDTKWG